MLPERESADDAPGRLLYQRFIAGVEESRDVLSAVTALMAPGGLVHVQNGDVVPRTVAERHAIMMQAILPDMTLAVDDVFFPDGLMVMQVRFFGSVRPGIPHLPPGMEVVSLGCVVARPNTEGLIEEMWSQVNPGFPFSYPRTGVNSPVPQPDGAGPEHARALYEDWLRRANAGTDFIRAVSGTVAPNGAVYLGNGDVGGGQVLEGLFARIAQGLPDISLEIDKVIFSGDRVVVLFTMSGTHLGPIGVWPASGRTLPSTGALIARANRQSQASELWTYVAPGYAITLPPTAPR